MPLPEYIAPGAPDPVRLVARFEFLEATTPEQARSRDELERAAWIPRGIWEAFVDQGVIREAAPGQFYLARYPRHNSLKAAF
jgi:hypothetical protein